MSRFIQYNKPQNLKNYVHKHLVKVKQNSGEFVNVLYLLKETVNFYTSMHVWSSHCSNRKYKKADIKFNIELPILTGNKDALKVLEIKVMNIKDNDNIEIEKLLSEWYPDKDLKYVFEMDNQYFSWYAWGKVTKGNSRCDEEFIKYLNKVIGSWFEKDEQFDYVDAIYQIGKHLIHVPYIFSETCLKHYDGEFCFVVTDNTVYYDIKRHF